MQAGLAQMARAKPQPLSAIVVTGNHHDRQAALLAQLDQYLIQQRDRRSGWHRAVVNIARDQHGIHLLAVDDLQQLLQHMTLVIQQGKVVK